MKKILTLLAIAATAIFAAEPAVEDNVLVLTDANFDETIAKHDYILVEFYAPWCGHCKTLAPEYAKAAKTLSENTPPYALAKVDATENKQIAEKFKVQGFPTLFWFKSGKQSEFTGGRTADDIVSWILKKAGPPSTAVTCEELTKKVADNKLVLAFFGDATSAEFKTFEETANSPAGEKFQFFHSDDKACAESNKAHNMPAVVLFRKFDESPVVFAEKIENPALNVFTQTESVPTLIDFSEDYIEPIFGNKKAALFLFRSAENKDSAYMKTFAEASKSMKGDILFVESGVSEGIQERLAEFIGVTKDDMPTMRILDPAANMKKFTWEGKMDDLNADAISKFVGDFKAGSLEAFLKSEDVPAEQGDVTVLVGKNFKELVIDSEDDVLVMFYAPWCGHCKKLTPIWEELGKDIKDVKGLKIAKMDSTANEVDGVEVKGYPTLKFYAKGAKDAPVDYDGERGAEDFKKWLKEKSVHYKSHEESKADL